MKRLLRLITVFLMICYSLGTMAAPYNGTVQKFKQPDGTLVSVKLFGDEYYIRGESLDGYTLIRDDKTGWICYAKLSDDKSELISTGIVYKPSTTKSASEELSSLGLSKHLDLAMDQILKKAETRRKELDRDKPYSLSPQTGSMLKAGGYNYPKISGNIKGLCILVDFPDEPASISINEIKNFCNGDNYTGYGNNGSLKKYFYDMSGGKLIYENVVFGYYRAPKTFAVYDNENYSGGVIEILSMALNALKAQGFNFSTLTTNPDGTITAINLMYTGKAKKWAKGMWYHKGYYSGFYANGVRSGDYNCSPADDDLSIGTICHENGHMLNKWPDTYKYNNTTGPDGIGAFDLMCWYGDEKNPLPPNPYFQMKSGWTNTMDIANVNTTITDQSNSHTIYRYNPSNSTEYYILKARQRSGRSASLEDEGLTIWHINENGDNQTWNHEVYLVHANNNVNDHSQACFKSSFHPSFDDNTTPSAKWWNGSNSGLKVSQISGVGSTMTYKINNGTNPPCTAMGAGATIEAENYCNMYGIQTESCVEGGSNVGWIDAGDWMTYSINVTKTGSYTIQYRVASLNGGGTIQLESAGGATVFGTVAVPKTSDWQSWTTISHKVNLTAGTQTVAIKANQGGFNINWWKFTSNDNPSFYTKIEAENYSIKSTAPKSEACSEGGLNMGWIGNGDWFVYPVTIPQTATYTVTYRVASAGSGGKIQLDKDAGATILGYASFNGTGGWQNWTSVSHNVSLPAGTYNLGLNANIGGFNINWLEIKSYTPAPGGLAPTKENEPFNLSTNVYPNPFMSELRINNPYLGSTTIQMIDVSGRIVINQVLKSGYTSISTDKINSGIYILRLINGAEVQTTKVIKK